MQEETQKREEGNKFLYYSPKDLVVKVEDLKIKDYTKPINKKKMNRNYNFLFAENESIRICSLYKKFCRQVVTKGEKIKAIATALRLRLIEKVKKFYMEEETIWESIHYLTANMGEDIHKNIMEEMLKAEIVSDIKENNGIICIKTNFGEIKFSTITNFFPNIEFDEEIEDIKTRMGQIDEESDCHGQAIEYSQRLSDIGIENDVVTGNRYLTTDKSSNLHSWNEFQINGKEHVLDYTQNVVMNKEGYYALNHINKVLSRVNCQDIPKDKKIINQMTGRYYMDVKTYLTCRDEIMQNLQKNKEIFEEER